MPRSSRPFSFICILGGLARLVASASSTVSVVATDTAQLADKLHLNKTCASYVNIDPQGRLEPENKLLIPVACCESSCQGPFCGQRVECGGDRLSAEPTATDPPAIPVVVQGEDVAPMDPPSPPATATVPKTTVIDDETLTLYVPSTLSIPATVTTDGATYTLEPTSLSVETGKESSAGPSASSEMASEPVPMMLVGESEIAIPSSTTTVTDGGGEHLTIGPSGIVLESTTIAFPPGPTTLSTVGVTITFEESAVEPPQTGLSTGVPVTSGSNLPTQITNAPSASSPDPTTVPPRETPGPGIAVVLGGQQSYVLPETGSVDILQPDGSTITLFPTLLVSGTQTVSADPATSQTHSPWGDLTVETGPAPEGSPNTNGASGFDGLVNALDNLSSTASSIVDTLGQIDDLGTQWAAGGMSDSQFATSVGPLFDSAVPTLSRFEATLRSALRQFSGPSMELTEDGWREVFEAHTASQKGFDITASLRNAIQSFSRMKNRVIDVVEGYWREGTVVSGALAKTAADLDRFASYDWQRKKSPVSSTTSTNRTEAVVPTRRSTSSSASSTATAIPYLLSSKPGTDPATFDDYLKTISKDVYREDKHPDIPWQSQVVNLTAKQAQDAERQPFMDIVYLITEPEEEPDSDSTLEHTTARVFPRASGDFVRRENSDEHLKLISTGTQGVNSHLFGDSVFAPGDILRDHLYDPILGKGQTIYIIDEGFNIQHTELAQGDRRVTSKFFSNSVYLPYTPVVDHAPESIDSHSGHGTHVASIAGGITHGVAPNANLVLVKQKNAARNPYTGRYHNRQVTPYAIDEVWTWLIEDVLNKRRDGNTGKFIVNLSWGIAVKTTSGDPIGYIRNRLLQRALELCWEHDIITIVAAGNEGEDFAGTLDRFAPTNNGKDDNPLITVGGVHADGKVWTKTTWKKTGGVDSEGSISVYALAHQVLGAGSIRGEDGQWLYNEATDATEKRDGTSQAAPAVAGLAAYFASLDSLREQFPTGSVAQSVKDYIVRAAYRRSDDPVPSSYRGKPSPESIIVAYNMAMDGFCESEGQERRSVGNSTISQSLARRQDTSQDLVMVDGDVIATSWSKSVCSPMTTSATPSSTTSPSATTTEQATTTSEVSSPPAPTVNINQGILTCESGTRDADDDTGFFGLDEMAAARDAFCGNMTAHKPPIVFEPGKNQFREHVYVPPNNIYHRIRVSARWVADADSDSDCQPFDFARSGFISTDGGKYPEDDNCLQRVDTAIQNCDPVRGQKDFWKRGGKFFRNCITWEIGAADDE